MKSSIKLLSVFLVILTLAGCGLKGPLYHPAEKTYVPVHVDLLNQTA
ncbi:LPS translocon maturation chaperone LptM [Gilliamella sp. wkB112]|nr:lipoprotein [Gilliamella apicola]